MTGSGMSDVQTFEQDFARICSMEGPLKVRLEALTRIIAIHDPEFADAYEELVRKLRAADAGGAAPKIGGVMPSFLLSDQNGHLVRLEDMLRTGPVVISFNRGHWCEYCDLELRAFAAAHVEFARRGTRVVSIMPERLEFLRRVSERTNHAFLTLSDMDNSYAMELGLVIWLGERVQKLLSGSACLSKSFKVTTRGSCQSLRRLFSMAMASWLRATSILISELEWTSTKYWQLWPR